MKRTALLLAAIAVFAAGLSGQGLSKRDLERLDKYYARMVQDWDVPGLSVGIVKDGELVFIGNYGTREQGKVEKPDEHTLYAIASNSKAFTTAVIGMLVQEGKLDWNDRVRNYLPYFELYDPWVSNEVTVRDLLCHRVGLGTFSGDVIWYRSDLTAEEIIRRLKFLPQAYDFRSGYGYSNVMYITAGELIRKITGKTWGENVRERILEPLGMDRTLTSPGDLDAKGNFATPHARKDDRNIPIAWVDWETVGATGGIISSVADLAKWMIFNLDNGVWGGDTILTKETRNMVWTPHNNFMVDHTARNDFDRHFSGYGLGWGLSDYHGHFRVGHTGAYDGFLTALTLIPDERLGVVVLTNGMKSPYLAATYYALDLFLGVESRDWSAAYLERVDRRQQEDTRIASRREKRVPDTRPSLDLEDYAGTYQSDIYGEIRVSLEAGSLRLAFEHSPELSATLEHWHYDVWEIKWDREQAWFSFGTLKFNMDNNLEVTGMDFDVPNNDIFFEELKPYRVKSADQKP
jgi:CubicO group peptidase (beta-lactamase class C family)